MATPLEKLDDAIHEYMRETAGSDWNGAVAGWALGIETTAIVNDPDSVPLADAQWYCSGPQTTSTQAIGLGRYVAEVYETHIVNRTLYSDDED